LLLTMDNLANPAVALRNALPSAAASAEARRLSDRRDWRPGRLRRMPRRTPASGAGDGRAAALSARACRWRSRGAAERRGTPGNGAVLAHGIAMGAP
jgi:hypothetical protein